MITYFNGSFLPLEDVHISPFDRGFQFADGVYEAMITYNSKLFLYDEHIARLKRSLGEIKLNFTGTGDLKWIIEELIKRNSLEDASVYLQITRGASYPRLHVYPAEETKPTIFISASGVKKNNFAENPGVKVILQNDYRWDRCDIKSLMLLPAVMAKQKARENNAYEAVWVRDGFLKEGSHTNLFVVKDGAVITPPLSNTILPGITRQYVIQLCRLNNISVLEEEIEAAKLNEFDEVFITGTTTEVRPVTRVDDITIKDGKTGEITGRITELFRKGTMKG